MVNKPSLAELIKLTGDTNNDNCVCVACIACAGRGAAIQLVSPAGCGHCQRCQDAYGLLQVRMKGEDSGGREGFGDREEGGGKGGRERRVEGGMQVTGIN